MQFKVRRDRLRVFFPLRPGVSLRVSDDITGPAPPPVAHLQQWGGMMVLCELVRTRSRDIQKLTLAIGKVTAAAPDRAHAVA